MRRATTAFAVISLGLAAQSVIMFFAGLFGPSIAGYAILNIPRFAHNPGGAILVFMSVIGLMVGLNILYLLSVRWLARRIAFPELFQGAIGMAIVSLLLFTGCWGTWLS